MDPLYSLDNLNRQSASVEFFRSSRVYSYRNGAVREWPVGVLTNKVWIYWRVFFFLIGSNSNTV